MKMYKSFCFVDPEPLLLPLQKLHYAEVKAVKGWKPNKEKPTLKRADKAVMDPDVYYGWLYQNLTHTSCFTVFGYSWCVCRYIISTLAQLYEEVFGIFLWVH